MQLLIHVPGITTQGVKCKPKFDLWIFEISKNHQQLQVLKPPFEKALARFTEDLSQNSCNAAKMTFSRDSGIDTSV